MPDAERRQEQEKEQRAIRRGVRGALIFGVAAATIELGVLLWLMYC